MTARAFFTIIPALLGVLAAAADETCAITSVEVSKQAVLTIEATPADADVTYTITSDDALPLAGPSGLTLDLTGIYRLDCCASRQDLTQSPATTLFINWEAPAITDDPADQGDAVKRRETGG